MKAWLPVVVGEYMEQSFLHVSATHPYLGVGVVQDEPGGVGLSTGRYKLVDSTLVPTVLLCVYCVLNVSVVFQNRREIVVDSPDVLVFEAIAHKFLLVFGGYSTDAGTGYGVNVAQCYVGSKSLEFLRRHPLSDLRHAWSVVRVVFPTELH